MNAKESEAPQRDDNQPEPVPPFVEGNHETLMTYDKGGVPLYVAVIWVAFLAAYVLYMIVYGLPDFAAWSE